MTSICIKNKLFVKTFLANKYSIKDNIIYNKLSSYSLVIYKLFDCFKLQDLFTVCCFEIGFSKSSLESWFSSLRKVDKSELSRTGFIMSTLIPKIFEKFQITEAQNNKK